MNSIFQNVYYSTLKLSFTLIFIGQLYSCSQFEKPGPVFDRAGWIGSTDVEITGDARYYDDNPAPLFRREFNVNDDLKSARLYITAAGYYRATLNGKRVGKNRLDPAWTNYEKTIYYSVYDITGEIGEGLNCIGVTLGNGFYNPLPMKMWGNLNLRESLPVGNPSFIATLILEYANGRTTEIVTDQSWRWFSGPLIKNNVYLGEFYDERKDITGWDLPGFDDRNWFKPLSINNPGGELKERFFPAIKANEIITPLSITASGKNSYLVDMGENFAGTFRAYIKGDKGDTVAFRFGERVYENGQLNPMTTVAGQVKRAGVGGPGAPPIAWQADTFIIGEKDGRWYSPEFTFHTYRYMELSGLRYKPGISDIQGIKLNSAVEGSGEFSCSSDLLNSVQEAVQRTFLSNLQGVQSDCPAREKFAYGGDLNATSEAFILNFDMHDFYRKTVYDWVDAINDSIFIDTAPYVGIRYCGLSWESAFLITQYYLYLYYNDTEIIRELYDMDLEWMDKVERIHPGLIVDEGLSDHESLEPVPVELTGTCHYLQCARIMATFSRIMGNPGKEKHFTTLAGELGDIIRDKYWIKPVVGPVNRQTLYSTLLYHDILPENERDAASDSLLKYLDAGPSGHITTGIFGTKYILEALSATGNAERLFEVVNSTEYPGWGFMISRGATTIWETWKESDNTYSNCHPMFGTVSEWFYRWLGGIRPDPGYPGFERFFINPSIPAGLTHVECSYNSIHGLIVSNWRKMDSGKIRFDISVPPGSTSIVKLPAGRRGEVVINDMVVNEGSGSFTYSDKSFNFELPAGNYSIVIGS